MTDILRQLVEDNDDGDATHGRIDDMTVLAASIDLAQSIALLDPTPAQTEALRADIAAALDGSASGIRREIAGHAVTGDLGVSGHENEFTLFVDGVRIVRVDVNFLDRRMAA